MTDTAVIRRDIRTLIARDPRLDPGGPVMIERLEPGFAGMIHLILGQQVSIEAADAMYHRLEALGPVTP
ncbi:MAG: DNA-3-methyladenine glycosylase 2 family protein, partial [Actinomycetota bacterium]